MIHGAAGGVGLASIELAKIAQMTSQTVKLFGLQPVLAMLSFSNYGSSEFEEATKISNAVKILHRYYPNINVDGPVQSDFALNKKMLKIIT